MFEFHGWISIVEEDNDEADISILDRRREELCLFIEKHIESIKGSNREFHLHRSINGSSHLVFTGAHNHRSEEIINFFKIIAKNQPHSYGKLFVRDDEDQRGFQNSMQEFTMARSTVTEKTDEAMSPCIPKIEEEYKF